MSRTLVVGFDGATLELSDRWMQEDRMPSLAALCADGSFGPMRSVFPYNSAVAWTSLSTGLSPGRHGIFDFVLPSTKDYRLRVATREDRRVQALWNHASAAGARVAIVNIPATFPAEPVNGVMVSGMDSPRLDERAVHPSDLMDRLRRLSPGYRILSNAAVEARRGDFDAAERELLETLDSRARFVCELSRDRDFDLLMVNFEATDGAHHFFWHHHDPTHPRHDRRSSRWADTIGRVYEATDRHLGRLMDAYAPDTVFVVSDHGGGPSNDWVIFMNDWLAEAGFLALRRGGPSSSFTRRLYGELRGRLPVPVRRRLRRLLGGAVDRARESALYGDVDWSKTRAFAQMQSGVRVNQAARESAGIVTEAERDPLLEELATRAREVTTPGSGEPAFASAERADRVYVGEAPGGWDLILDLAPGFHVRSRNTSSRPGFLHRLGDLGMYLPSGLHTPFGMVVAAGAGIDKKGRNGPFDIHQVTPSVLANMGVASPPSDQEPFDFLAAAGDRPAGGPSWVPTTSPRELAEQEEEEVLDRLRGLGYVD